MYRNVFVSYRRSDSFATAKKLADMLKNALSPNGHEVFFDVDEIEAGEPIPTRIMDSLELSKIMLVVIGPSWISIAQERFNQDRDYVRFELEFALSSRWIDVVPVLVDAAKMPNAGDLPGHDKILQKLIERDAITISSTNFGDDSESFVNEVKSRLKPPIRIIDYRDVAIIDYSNW